MDTSAQLPGGVRSTAGAAAPPAVTVTEEFLLLDRTTWHNVPVAGRVLADLPAAGGAVRPRPLSLSSIAVLSPGCAELAQLRRELVRLRRAAATASTSAGAALVAVGLTPLGDPDGMPAPRYRTGRYGPAGADLAGCGCQVHVGVPDAAVAAVVGGHIRLWLPVLRALTANSPLYEGSDTGHASWRSVRPFRSSGLVNRAPEAEQSGVSWYVGPAVTGPAVVIHVGDVCPTVDDTVLVAGLVRALVATVIEDVRTGRPVHHRVSERLLAAAHWRAARDGLDGTLIDLRLGCRRPAWDLVDELFATVSPALLRHGDLHLVIAELARLRRQGNGATRQRRIHRRTGDLHAVLTRLAEQTTGHG